jgi:peptidoglycan hydrolase-like protein with peptidoglycan-binding domain
MCYPTSRSEEVSMNADGTVRLWRRGWIGLSAFLTAGIVACAGGGSSKSTTTTARLATVATSATSATARATSTSAASFLPGQVATVATNTSTTLAGRVVDSPNNYVHLEDSGPGVKEIQAALAAGGYKVSIDGQFGPQTQAAVRAFQQKEGLTEDGIVGPVTWRKLRAAGTSTSSPTTTVKTTTTTRH